MTREVQGNTQKYRSQEPKEKLQKGESGQQCQMLPKSQQSEWSDVLIEFDTKMVMSDFDGTSF